jgi:hypothetical protein
MQLMDLNARYDRLQTWHRKFALMPTTLMNGKVVWLEWIERRLQGGKARFDDDGLIPIWEYRRAN